MGSLRTAQRALVQAETISDSEDDSDDGQVESTSKTMASKERSDHERPKAAPRQNKHAYVTLIWSILSC